MGHAGVYHKRVIRDQREEISTYGQINRPTAKQIKTFLVFYKAGYKAMLSQCVRQAALLKQRWQKK